MSFGCKGRDIQLFFFNKYMRFVPIYQPTYEYNYKAGLYASNFLSRNIVAIGGSPTVNFTCKSLFCGIIYLKI